MRSCIRSLTVFLLFVAGLPVASFAQTSTDAGALRQQIEKERQEMLQGRDLPVPQVESFPEKKSTPDELKIIVSSFRFEGNTLFTDEELAAVVELYLHHPISYAQLQSAAAAVGEVYRKKGWAVRSFLPQQDIVNGVIIIQIVEAKFGKVLIEEGSYGWPRQKKIDAMVAGQQNKGAALNTRKLDRALLLLDDLPGVTASGRLQEGGQAGETDLVIKTEKESLASGIVMVDNEGSRSTDDIRVHSFTQLMNPFGIGDQSSAYVLYSEGLRFARLEQTFPVGQHGWRVGANASVVDYKILPSEFEALRGKGASTSFGAQASYPLIRTRPKNLYFNFNYDYKYFENVSQGASSSKYKVDTYAVALRGNVVDKFFGGGSTSSSLSVILGSLYLGALSTGEDPSLDGSFQKMLYNIARQQTIIPKVSLYAALSGQLSPDNKLDSSEKFYLGGPGGVRAYPVSEGSGVEGRLLTTELRWRFAPQFQLSTFYDHGRVNNEGDVRSYSLEGAGLEMVWQSKFGLSVKATWAHRIGDNPNSTSSGDDQDGSLVKDRFWLRIAQQF